MQDADESTRGSVRPPYAPVKGVLEFFEQAKGRSAPARIDRAYLKSIGIAAGNEQHLVVALKFLRLIDETGRPGRHFSTLYMKGPDRKRGLQNMVREAYPSLFTGEVDLRTVTRPEVHDHFVRRYGVQGQMARKVTALFVLLCNVAEIPVSSYLTSTDNPSGARGDKARSNAGRLALKSEPELATGLGLPIVITLTPELSLDEMVVFLRRVKQAVAIVSRDNEVV